MRLDHLDQLLQSQCHLSRDQIIVVGVSGGPDSLCLADALHRLGYPIWIAHFDHQLRPASSTEAAQVREFARVRGIPFELASQDVAAFARQNTLSLEEAARITRYRFLFATARDVDAQAVAVGHTADDQVETVLMHLLRGAGLAGLKGMRLHNQVIEWDEHIPLVRPLLETWRGDLGILYRHALNPVFDPSNQDPTFFRNRLRRELIPYLENYNPRVRAGAAAYLARPCQRLRLAAGNSRTSMGSSGMVERGDGFTALDFGKVQSYSPGLQKSNLLRQSIARLRPSLRDFDFAAIEHALQYIADPKRTDQCDWAVGLRLALEGGRLYLADWSADLPSSDWPQLKNGEILGLDPAAGWNSRMVGFVQPSLSD